MNIGENIKRIRKSKGMTQKTLSNSAGLNISVRTLQKYESGEITPPIDKINSIAKTLDVTISELIGAYDNETNKYNFDKIEHSDLVEISNIKFQEMANSFSIKLETLKPLDEYLKNFKNLTKEEFIDIYENYESSLIISISLLNNTMDYVNRIDEQNKLIESYRKFKSEVKNLMLNDKYKNK